MPSEIQVSHVLHTATEITNTTVGQEISDQTVEVHGNAALICHLNQSKGKACFQSSSVPETVFHLSQRSTIFPANLYRSVSQLTRKGSQRKQSKAH